MSECKHFRNGVCGVAADYLGIDRQFDTRACIMCKQIEHPMTLNEVTASLIIHQANINEIEIDREEMLRLKQHLAVANGGGSPPDSGVGTELSKLTAWIARDDAECKCKDRVLILNSWGIAKCRKEQKTIIKWLREGAERNGVPFIEAVAKVLLNRAIARAERNAR